ncbi:MAG TPA: long-chain fatty acid--CoA ligase [Thermoanaerobaculia bacterium]|nr:long-chain fatty acid--CoA ligase [Thermoanaerobaculia bacterium]
MADVSTLYDIFEGLASSGKDAVQMSRDEAGKWTSVSARDFGFTVRCLSLGLNALGMQPGDRVAILSENRPEWAMADYAIICGGALSVPIYATLPAEQIVELLRDSGAKIAVVSTAEQLEKIRVIRDRCPELDHVIAIDAAPPDEPGYEHWIKTIDRGRGNMEMGSTVFEARASRIRPSDPCTIIYTSGTTGEPKGAVLTHANFVSNVLACCQIVPIRETSIALSFLPLSHVFERMLDYAYAYRQSTIGYLGDVTILRDALVELEPTVFGAVPRVYEKIYAAVRESVAGSPVKRAIFAFAVEQGRRRLRRMERGEENPTSLGIRIADRLVFSKLRARLGRRFQFAVSGGAPLSRELAEFFWGAGVTIYEGYGLTETSPVICVNGPGRWKLGTVGRPVPGVEVRIADDGEILTRGPHVMKGYFGKPAETAEVIDRDGWFATGDIGELDDGFLRITDRKKDVIVLSGGKKAAPQPIENALKQSALIEVPIVIGNARKFIAALIVPRFEALKRMGLGARPLESPEVQAAFQKEIDAYNEGKPHYEQIRAFTLLDRDLTLDAGEITPTMKVKRRVIEERYKALIDRMYEEKPHGT